MKALVSFLLFLLLFWTTAALAQSANPPPTQTPPTTLENSTPGEGMEGGASAEPPQRSRADGWFNRSGSGLFISLTPFATAVTLLVLLLIILLPFFIRAAYKRGTRGYFKTVQTGQRRVA
ncbi:MAG: hypothetical protein MPW14_04150 [Candidatus Manganitrophus sp.]|nr:hypothetical protein [Candidatus Manganitrophus sp.]MDC4225077.1 hypothetical protein [Candidatus Manganitrophus sp.]WDT71666.1 MAG: hypothetical protein MPW17_02120 [Candidatus Manganitrophus sp.]WDT80981.1 MAG: hypothetical protein MPW14_04150 [Candidatus Manganitrophus sp.]